MYVWYILICLTFSPPHPPPNFCCCQDPHGELQGQNVLIVRYSVELTAAHFGISVEKVNELLASARAKMAAVRKSRPRPHLDNKMLASWNGNVCKRIQYSNTPHMRKLKQSICAGGCLIIRGCSIGVRFETTKMRKMSIICDFF